MMDKFHPTLNETWARYTKHVQKADIIRYALLSSFGGVYMVLVFVRNTIVSV